MYIEASFPRGRGDFATLISPSFKVPSSSSCQMQFWYHMYGGNVGSLSVNVIYGSTNRSVYTFNGATKANLWYSQVVSLSSSVISSPFKVSLPCWSYAALQLALLLLGSWSMLKQVLSAHNLHVCSCLKEESCQRLVRSRRLVKRWIHLLVARCAFCRPEDAVCCLR